MNVTDKPEVERSMMFFIVFLIGSILISMVMTLPVWFSPTTHIATLHQLPSWLPGDSDVWLFIWNMWWILKAQNDPEASMFETSYLFHPDLVSLRFHSFTLFNSLIGAQVYRLTGNWIVVYNLLFLSTFVLTMLTTFLLLYHLSRHRIGAVLGCFSFAFCSFHMLHGLQHLNLMSVQFLPLTAYFLVRYLENRSWRWMVAGILSTVLNFFSSFYYGVLVILFLGTLSLFKLIIHRGPDLCDQMVRIILFLGSSTIVLVLCVIVLLGGLSVDEYSPLDSNEHTLYSADILSWLLPNPLHPLWGDSVRAELDSLPGNIIERSVTPGYAVLLIVFIGFLLSFSRHHRNLRPWLLTAFTFIVLSFGPQLTLRGQAISVNGFDTVTPFQLFKLFPILNHFRAPSRFSVIALLCFSVIVCEVTAIFFRTYNSKPNSCFRLLPYGITLLGMVLIFETWSVPFPVVHATIPPVYHTISLDPVPGAVMEVPLDPAVRIYQWYQTLHQRPLLSGFLARFPQRIHEQLSNDPVLLFFSLRDSDHNGDQTPRHDTFKKLLEDRNVRYLLVHREFLSPARQTAIISFMSPYRHLVFEDTASVIAYRFPTFDEDVARGEAHVMLD